MKALVLDFDGVISASGREALVVACSTYLAIRPQTRLVDMDPAEIRDAFISMMPLGRRAEDYAVFLASIEAGIELEDQVEFDRFRDAQDAQALDAFHDHFYDTRAAFRRDDPRGWRELFRSYGPLADVLHRHAGEVPYAIATAKDRSSVLMLLRDFGLDALFSPELIADKEVGRGKDAHLGLLLDRLGVAPAETVLVDDKVSNLDAVAPLGVRCVLAAWGYNGERERTLASGRGYLVCSLEGLERSLFD